jgi:hypothetical protein
MQLIGKNLVGFSLHGVPSTRRQIIKNANLETNFWYARNSKKIKTIRTMTDISVKSELFNFFSRNFHKVLFQNSPDFSVTEKSRKWVIFKRNPEN